ncbi:MAG: class I SAM-dependent methyltransferase [Eggerthellaceae bacterium]|nr:class I SAM-dependent methyltransferase [Eggerthellaceae bacterium]
MAYEEEASSALIAYETAMDVSISGIPLARAEQTRYRAQGAHDPTSTHYFVLDHLFRYYSFCSVSHLLDVGCGTGRVLAYFLHQGFPGKVTGVELDSELAEVAQSWTLGHNKARVLVGDVLNLDLSEYTDFYLYNPFDSDVLQQFIAAVEHQVKRPCTVIHMSDNGETWWYTGRRGWDVRASGEFSTYRNAQGDVVWAFDHPQHYTVWRYAGSSGVPNAHKGDM